MLHSYVVYYIQNYILLLFIFALHLICGFYHICNVASEKILSAYYNLYFFCILSTTFCHFFYFLPLYIAFIFYILYNEKKDYSYEFYDLIVNLIYFIYLHYTTYSNYFMPSSIADSLKYPSDLSLPLSLICKMHTSTFPS